MFFLLLRVFIIVIFRMGVVFIAHKGRRETKGYAIAYSPLAPAIEFFKPFFVPFKLFVLS
jgi:hypothetical protein